MHYKPKVIFLCDPAHLCFWLEEERTRNCPFPVISAGQDLHNVGSETRKHGFLHLKIRVPSKREQLSRERDCLNWSFYGIY